MVNGHCLGPRDASILGAVPPLTAALASDGSPPLVTVSACSLVLRGSQPRARPSRLRLPQAPRAPLFSSAGGKWLRESGHLTISHTRGWRNHSVSFPARVVSSHLLVVLPADYPGVQRGGPLVHVPVCLS